MNNVTNNKTTRSLIVTLMTLTTVGLVLWFAWSMLPKGYNEDLSRIGKGRPVVVLLHNKDDVGSITMLGLLDTLRDKYSDHYDFLLADVNTPAGASFTRQYNTRSAQVLIFSAQGQKLDLISDSRDSKALRHALESHSR